jgi:hypothetical protein
MDQTVLVNAGHTIVKALDTAGIPPRAAMWVHNTDTNAWKLWIVPHASVKDKRDFYRRIADIVSKHRAELGGIDASDTELVSDEHPAIRGLRVILKMPGLGAARFTDNRFNGFFLPDGIILRMDV